MDHLFRPKNEFQYDVVVSSDNYDLECHYQGHSFYSLTKTICVAMHLIFLKYCPIRSRVAGSTLRLAINHFFDFAQWWNSIRPNSLWIREITDLSAEVFKGFENYLLANNINIDNSGYLKAALKNAASLTEAIPDLMLPVALRAQYYVREPLTNDADQQLEEAFKAHADNLYSKLEFREKVHKSTAYTFEEIKDLLTYSRQSIFQWVQHAKENGLRIGMKRLRKWLAASTDTKFRQIACDTDWKIAFFQEYDNRDQQFRYQAPPNPYRGNRILNFTPDLHRVIKTLLDNGYPLNMSLNEIGEKYAVSKLHSIKQCEDAIQLIMFRWHFENPDSQGNRNLDWDNLLGMYFPTMADMSGIIQFILLQTNWNKESALALDRDNLEHALTGMMNEDHVMLQTEKSRSQGIDKPYHAPKEIVAGSSRSDKYSAHNLFLLADKLSEPLRGFDFDYITHGMTASDHNESFLCLRFYGDWVTKGGRHTSASNAKAFQQGTKQFLKQHPIYENGERLTSGNQLTTRLRPTWVKRQKASKNTSHGLLALFMGHAQSVTTDVHYDNSALAQLERFDRLESELEAVLALMLSGNFEGMLGTPPEKAVQLPFKVFHIPGMEKALWACANQRKPAWHGAELRIREGERCYVISKCMFCSQCTVFEDSLPYLIERRIHVNELLEDQSPSSSDYSNDLQIELMIVDSILDKWDDQDAVLEAVRYQRQNAPLLPRDLNFLQVILEEEDRE
jgi:predicted DNA-binding protein YlxM (UPF0122 family)